MSIFYQSGVITEEEDRIIEVVARGLFKKINKLRANEVTAVLAVYAQEKGARASYCDTYTVFGTDIDVVKELRLQNCLKMITGWPTTSNFIKYTPDPLYFGELPSGVYRANATTAAIVINTTLGRFIACLRSEMTRDYDVIVKFAAVLARVLSNLRQGDIILRKSQKQLAEAASELFEPSAMVNELLAEVDELFKSRRPEITTWKLRCGDNPSQMFFV